MATASQEANRYQMVEEVLTILSQNPGKRLTRRKLFGTKHQAWQVRLLRTLCNTGVIKRTGKANLPHYQVADLSALETVLGDEVAISALAWPTNNAKGHELVEKLVEFDKAERKEGSMPPEMESEAPAPEGDGEIVLGPPPRVPLPEGEEPQTEDDEDVSPQKVAEITLKLLGAFVENFAWMREKITALEKEVQELRNDVKEWRKLWE